ncbi:MAG TPA: helix-turn-helix domain-containing protein [bacterium]|nr:helix-turn-helix domain-containing protein [bacterium]
MLQGYGEILKKAREEQGLKHQEIQRVLKIDAFYLRAMEEERLEDMDKPIYMKLFLKTYARYLKLNVSEILELFAATPFVKEQEKKKELKREMLREEVVKDKEPKPRNDGPAFSLTGELLKNKNTVIIAASAVVVVIIGVIIALSVSAMNKNRAVIEEGKNIYIVKDKKDVLDVVAKASDDVWMKSRAEGREEDFLLKKGQEKRWEGVDKVVFLVGNAAGVEFVINGQPTGLIGEQGEVINGLVFQAGKNWFIDRSQGFKRTPPTPVPTKAPEEAAPEQQGSAGTAEEGGA